MKNSINEIFEEYKFKFWVKVDSLTQQRRQNFTQTEMAQKLKVSLKKIQMFEKFECLDAYLIFGYKRILSKSISPKLTASRSLSSQINSKILWKK